MECHLLLAFTALLTLTSIEAVEASVDEELHRYPFLMPNVTPNRNPTDNVQSDSGCGSDCAREQCIHGCSLWIMALETSCKSVCDVTTETVSQKEIYCVAACNSAINKYFSLEKHRIGTPPSPALVADSLTATSLSLEWKKATYSHFKDFKCVVQWRYEESDHWHYCRNQTWMNHTSSIKNPSWQQRVEIVRIYNLQPYTKYRFRISIITSEKYGAPINSDPSSVIITRSHGRPTSAPKELQAFAIGCNRVFVSWQPGFFPNGPIVSYVLRLTETAPNGYSTMEELKAEEKNMFYIFEDVLPDKEYRVGVSMRNSAGLGPPAHAVITTPPFPIPAPNQQPPVLIVGGERLVFQQNPDMTSDPTILYDSSRNTVKGIGIHITKDLLFVSNSNNSVTKLSLSRRAPPITILSSSLISYIPLDLSVDWLNDHLYILGEVYHTSQDGELFSRWQIVRCDLDGRSQTIAFAGLQNKPIHVEVDPYNGYLFWVQSGDANGGLYRLDLAHISNGVKHEVLPDQILKEANLGPFTVDYANYRVFVPHLQNNTVLSVSLDGREVVNFRKNTQRPMFQNVQSLTYANGLFYWTNGRELIVEEYHKAQDTYYHNSYTPDLSRQTFNHVLVYQRSRQPMPVAVNPPVALQSVMGVNYAKITWKPPHLLGHQGNGAWQQWDYSLQITDEDHNSTGNTRIIGMTNFTARNLNENTFYTIKIAAVTSSGVGPWSSEFIAKTLSSTMNGSLSSMLWSANEGLLQTDLTGDNIQTLIHKSYLKNSYITGISWYKDQLYLVTNTSNVIWYNMTSKNQGWLPDMDNVGSLAVDWIGKKLYWSSPKQQLIMRGNLNGTSKETVPIIAVGKELKIDSYNGFIYWNTGHEIECSRLNGEHKIVYYPAQLYVKQVKGLTVDLEGKFLYWIIYGYEGSNLYKAPTADSITSKVEISGTLISSLSNTATIGPLCYFSDRLIWLQDVSHAVISDVMGHNKANLYNKLTKTNAFVNMIAVVDPSAQNFPDDQVTLNVIPESVKNDSIQISGQWNMFNVTWCPITQVNHGKTFYEVKIYFNNEIHSEYTTTESYITYSRGKLPPFSGIDVSLKPYTYWGAASLVKANLQSPESIPSSPLNPRIYIMHHNDPIKFENEVRATLRWNKPMYPNGVIRAYKIECWFEEDGINHTVCKNEIASPFQYEYIAKKILRNVTLFFRVLAFNDAGYSDPTETISVSTDIESLIPKLAIAYHDSIRIVDLDLGYSHMHIISMNGGGKPIDFTVNLMENIVYWINDNQEIFFSRLYETGYIKIMSINGTGMSITIDWVSRFLYWSQIENSIEQDNCAIYQLNLNVYDHDRSLRLQQVLRRSSPIHKLQVSPITRSLYWVETDHLNLGKLMVASVNGLNIEHFFTNSTKNKSFYNKKECNCPDDPAVGRSFILDLTEKQYKKLFWVDAWSKHIMSSDFDGCHCRLVINATNFKDKALPPQLMTLDSKFLYWSNVSQKNLFCLDKKAQMVDVTCTRDVSTGHKILAIGNKIQPYPSKMCLSPKQTPLSVSMINRSSSSIMLMMPPPVQYNECRDVNTATPFYKIYYRPYAEDGPINCSDHACREKTTFDNTLHVNGLQPFTDYMFTLEINNYYGLLRNISPTLGRPVILKTFADAPSHAENIKTMILSPNHAIVEWLTLKKKDDGDIWFEIHLKMENTFLEHNMQQPNNITSLLNENITRANFSKLLPSQNYSIWIRSRSLNSNMHSDSKTVFFKTYPEPHNITVSYIGPYVLNISWMPYTKSLLSRYNIEFTEVGSEIWEKIDDEGFKKQDGSIHYVIRKLSPKTKYKFRLKLYYINNNDPYLWPIDNPFIFETTGDRPSPPGKPKIGLLKQLQIQQKLTLVHQLQWQPSKPHGSPIIVYNLYADVLVNNIVNNSENSNEAVSLSRQNRETNLSKTQKNTTLINKLVNSSYYEKLKYSPEPHWKLLYQGTDNYWIITDLEPEKVYIFYVHALNSIGWSGFSEPSDEFILSNDSVSKKITDNDNNMWTYIVTGAIIFAIVLTQAIYCFTQKCRRMRQNYKAPLVPPRPSHGPLRAPDIELANIRDMAQFNGSPNVVYVSGRRDPPTDAEIALLTQIRRDQLTLLQFLGSGAFGEVYEGRARDLGSIGERRVAIKTLPKATTTERQRMEFLQEAKFMSNFKHENILSMLGVCLDNDTQYIIMELMEGGDLLSYLRIRRPLDYTNDCLTLYELLMMCRDVTKGCRYLEKMHFVHRDLACRNCLVSHQKEGRIVKIGDFGLARDIYKNDYYRKDGEGLLPVRWLAVECITDGVYSRASDVWAWAILCWEVLTFGQQPYPGLSNRAVMKYVQRGGTLKCPRKCPEPLFQLLQKCWRFKPEQRPTFKRCLDVLDELMLSADNVTPFEAQEPQDLMIVPDAADMDAGEKNKECAGRPVESQQISQPILNQQSQELSVNPPRYLELVNDGEVPPIINGDGYEVPLSNNFKTVSKNKEINNNLLRRSFSESNLLNSGEKISLNINKEEVVKRILDKMRFVNKKSFKTKWKSFSNVIFQSEVQSVNSPIYLKPLNNGLVPHVANGVVYDVPRSNNIKNISESEEINNNLLRRSLSESNLVNGYIAYIHCDEKISFNKEEMMNELLRKNSFIEKELLENKWKSVPDSIDD